MPKLYYQILKSHVIPWMHVDGTSKFEEHQIFDIVQEQDQFLTAEYSGSVKYVRVDTSKEIEECLQNW